MGFGMEMLIMVALSVFILTGIVSIVLTVWMIKIFGPFYKLMSKQLEQAFGSQEKDDMEKVQDELNRVLRG